MKMVPNILTHNKYSPLRKKKPPPLSVFLDITGILHHEYLPSWQLVKQNIYKEECLRREMHQKRLELWLYKWVHHQDNVPAHSLLLEKQFLTP